MNMSKSAPANRPGLPAILLVAGLLALPAFAAEEQPPPAGTAPAPKAIPAERLDQLVAPIALYPDPLLMQILMASTYPLEIVQAARWIKERSGLRGAELDKALEEKTWDASVESLTHFPDVLGRMSKNLDWTSELGDAFLAQQADMLDAIQRMRKKANQAGKLASTKEQQVVVEKEVIKIVPADPQIVYVPTYVPQAVYGPPTVPPPYPAMYAYPPGYVATASVLSFGAGMAVGAAISGGCDWDNHDVNVYHHDGGGGGNNSNNSNNTVNIDNSKTINQANANQANVNKANVNKQTWQHNPEHRRGVSYQNQQVSQHDAANGAQGQQARDQARGYDRSANAAAQTRPATGAAAQTRPATGTATRPSGNDATARGAQGKQAPPTAREPSRPSTQQTASRGASGSDAFGGYGNGSAERSASARGTSSRSSASAGSAGRSSGGGGRPSGGSPQGGGGGGSGRSGGGGRRR